MNRTFDRVPGPQHISEKWQVADLFNPRPDPYDRLQNALIKSLDNRVTKLEGGFVPTPGVATLWPIDITLDQGDEGECVGHGVAHALRCQPKSNVSLVPTTVQDNPEAERLYERAQQIDGSKPDEQSGASVGAGIKAAVEQRAIVAFHWAASTADIRNAVQTLGPVVLGINWYTGMMETNSDGFILPTGALEGGHCILVRGFNPNSGAYVLHQSWGAWGYDHNGMCFLHDDDLARLLSEQGEAALITKP